MTAQEIAEKFSNRIVKVKLGKAGTVFDGNGHPTTSFDARVVGWKKAGGGLNSDCVIVEVLAPNTTKYALRDFKSGYSWTSSLRNLGGYGKKVLVSEITLPGTGSTSTYTPKDIPKWPHKCRDCGSPALVFMNSIDCSNGSCKNKFKTSSGFDLFLPKEMQAALKAPKVKTRPEVDKDGYLICTTCKARAGAGSWSRVGDTLYLTCSNKHNWTTKAEPGDKIVGNGGKALMFNGRSFI